MRKKRTFALAWTVAGKGIAEVISSNLGNGMICIVFRQIRFVYLGIALGRDWAKGPVPVTVLSFISAKH